MGKFHMQDSKANMIRLGWRLLDSSTPLCDSQK